MLIARWIIGFFVFVFSVAATGLLLTFFKKTGKLGQFIRPEGPSHHLSKTGTPSMGGIAILITFFISVLIAVPGFFSEPSLFAVVFICLSFSLIGGLDDSLKSISQSNQGLYGWQKLALQILAAALILTLLLKNHYDLSQLQLAKLFPTLSVWFLFLYALSILIGSANAVNLTDGLDGLASGCLAIWFFFFPFLFPNTPASILAWILSFTCLGFLVFNRHPAKIFMGDVGSLGLGGAMGALALVSHSDLWLILSGGVFVLEALSVILQVACFKLTKKRIFRMSPFHHHLELGGWSETQVVYRLWTFSFFLSLLALFSKRIFS